MLAGAVNFSSVTSVDPLVSCALSSHCLLTPSPVSSSLVFFRAIRVLSTTRIESPRSRPFTRSLESRSSRVASRRETRRDARAGARVCVCVRALSIYTR